MKANKLNKQGVTLNFINFVKKGKKATKSVKLATTCLLSTSNDWELIVDLVDRLVIPEEIVFAWTRNEKNGRPGASQLKSDEEV